MSRDSTPATIDPQSHRGPWRLIYGDGAGTGQDPSTGIPPMDGATNMAIDVALLESVKAGAPPVLRLYRWAPACLSFGRNQPTRDRYDMEAAATRGIDLVRRPTGGQAVLHHHELTYAVIAPVDVIGKPRAAYGWINRALVDGLGRLGVRAALAEGGGPGGGGGAGSGPDWDAACFRQPERGEVVVGGAKLVGSAQRMEARTILQHGSILVAGTQAPAEELLLSSGAPNMSSGPTATLADPWTTLERELSGRPDYAAIAAAVRSGFAEMFGIELEGTSLAAAERERVVGERARFASDEWTWRR